MPGNVSLTGVPSSKHELVVASRVNGASIMWDTVSEVDQHLSHDLPCQRCGHAPHTYLACDALCDCAPVRMPGSDLASIPNS
jgi:hypothetical protein